ncbi:MAG: serine/threonine protein kinase [Planctomycetia bacterium]|nr:serine/threonine protein kinase [Planctomycetia bacterium]
MSEIKIGKFEILNTLGSGAHSSILHIRRAEDDQQYALKVVAVGDPEEDMKYVAQAEHEFRVASMINHPNLIKIYALEKVKNWFFKLKKVHMLIEFVNGKTLDQAPRLSLPRLVQVFKMVADGMVHMHRKEVCHGDLKPNNVMLSRTGEVKIIDYGLARIKSETVTRVRGTPEYMAPEQVTHSLINERTDIYNLGGMMYRLVTFKLPPAIVTDDDPTTPMDGKVWQRMYKPVLDVMPKCPPVLANLIDRCLKYDAMKRPERMSEIQSTLDRLADELVTPENSLETLEW